ncbi:MAG: enolase C-terminal domain-like protein, partial [Pseudomonadota bacterium]
MKIRSFSITCVQPPLAIPHKTASGTIAAAPLVLLDIETDAGITGSTYIFVYTPMALKPVAGLLADLGDLLSGYDVAPRDVAALVQAKFRLAGNQGFAGMAAAAIDMALWDCLARAADLPLCRLLGASPSATRAYDSMGQMPPDETARQVETSMKAGYRAFKIKAGHPDPSQDERVLEAMLSAAGGEEIWMAVDFNQAFSPVISIERARRLERFELAWLEEPARAEDNAGHAQVRAGISIPIQTGENWWGIADMQRSLDAGASDHAMPDV